MFKMFTLGAAGFAVENSRLLCRILFIIYMTVLSVIDIKWKKLPLLLLLSGTVFPVAEIIRGTELPLIVLAAGGTVGILFLAVSKVTGEAFGYGDSLLILVMGSFVGFWKILYLLLGAFSTAAVFSVFMLIRTRFNRKSSFPFVPFLTAAYIGGVIFGGY